MYLCVCIFEYEIRCERIFQFRQNSIRDIEVSLIMRFLSSRCLSDFRGIEYRKARSKYIEPCTKEIHFLVPKTTHDFLNLTNNDISRT